MSDPSLSTTQDSKRQGGLVPAPLGAPLAGVFAIAALLRRWLYDRGWIAAGRASVPTISVGGLEVGGTGKTPVAGVVLSALLAAGRRPGLLSRGYGRGTQGLVLRAPGEPALPEAIGDEPAMLVREGRDVWVAACERRLVGARRLAELGCDVLVLDDGFSHRALARDLEIVVLRGEAPLGNGHLLPWGTLREPASSLRRAHVVWVHHREGQAAEPPAVLKAAAPQALMVVSESVGAGARGVSGEPVALAGRRVLAAAGVARPHEIRRALERQGAIVLGLEAFADHHAFTSADAARLRGLVASQGAEALVVTAKDAVKLAPVWSGPPLWVLGSALRLVSGAEALAARLEVPASTLLGILPLSRTTQHSAGPADTST